MDNVELVVEIWPTPLDLAAGGVPRGNYPLRTLPRDPKTKRANYHSALPDKIVIFAAPSCSVFGEDHEIVRKQVRTPSFMKIGHHFGMSDEEIRKAGK